MARSWLYSILVVAACALVVMPATAQQPNQQPPQGQQQLDKQQPNQNQNQLQPNASASAGTKVQGKIERIEGNNQIVVRTQDNREVTLFASPQSHFMINNQAGRFADLKVGTDINADFMAHNGQNMIGTLTVGAAGAQLGAAGQAQAQSPLLNGKVTRVVGNQVFIQTADGREMSLYFAPQPGMGLDAHAGLQSNAGLVWNGQAWVQQPGGQIQGNLQTDLNAQPGVNLGLQPFSGYYAPTVQGAVYTDFGAPVFYNDIPWRRPLLRIGAGLFGRIR